SALARVQVTGTPVPAAASTAGVSSMCVPATIALPLVGDSTIATAVIGPPLAPAAASNETGTPACVVSACGTPTGAGSASTWTTTVAGDDVPPGPDSV